MAAAAANARLLLLENKLAALEAAAAAAPVPAAEDPAITLLQIGVGAIREAQLNASELAACVDALMRATSASANGIGNELLAGFNVELIMIFRSIMTAWQVASKQWITDAPDSEVNKQRGQQAARSTSSEVNKQALKGVARR